MLGAHAINIGMMQVGRMKMAGEALMGINVDTPVPRDVLQLIKAEAGIAEAWSVEL
jgi:D-3-phosphoglycerate dehydrogenase